MRSLIRPTLRMFRQDPGYAVAFIVTLGLGIGATTAIFSAVEGVLIRPLPYPHADRIVYVEQPITKAHQPNTAFSFVEVADYRSQARSVDEFVEYGDWQFNVVGIGEPQLIYGGLVTSNYFKVLAIRPLFGRSLDRRGRQAQLGSGRGAHLRVLAARVRRRQKRASGRSSSSQASRRRSSACWSRDRTTRAASAPSCTRTTRPTRTT